MVSLQGDSIEGVVYRVSEDQTAVVVGEPISIFPAQYTGVCYLRYGFALLHIPGEYFLPALVNDDFRRQHQGINALRLMLEEGDKFPRADVHGYRVSTGELEEYFMKEIDLAAPIRVYVFVDESSVIPYRRADKVFFIGEEGKDVSIPWMLKVAENYHVVTQEKLNQLDTFFG